MVVEFEDDDLDRLETDRGFTAGFAPAIVKAFRKRMQYIRGASDERDLYEWRSLHFEKLHNRGNQRSIRLNDQWRLVVELVGKGTHTRVRVIGIEDYH